MGSPKPDLSEFHNLTELEEVRRQLSAAQAKIVTSRTKAAQAAREIRELQEQVDQLQDAVGVIEATKDQKPPAWLTAKTSKAAAGRATLVACFSDFHFGEVVRPSEMNWYNAYDPEIAAKRIERFFRRTILMAREYFAGVEYDGIVLASLGDTISGDIHDEYRETNELSNFEAVPEVVPLIEAGIVMLAEEFKKVHYVGVPGNHPRDSRKPRYKKRSAHNADTMISKLLARRFEGEAEITFDIPDAFSADFKVYETKFRAEHGDEATGGSGIQGAMLPVALRTQRVRKQAEAEKRPFDVLLIGHWHQYMSVPSKGFLVNGAGKGYDEYARGKGFEPEAPQQALLLVTPEHGVGVQAPLFVGHRDSEGW